MIIPPWSFSTIEKYETCPAQFHAAKVTKKYPDVMNEQGLWGNRVHQALDKRITVKQPLPEGMQQWEPLAAVYDNPGGRLLSEYRFALDKQFRPAKWTACWVRGIIDVAVLLPKRASAIDWKTGKKKPDSGQLKLSAAAIMHTFPYVEEVNTAFAWLQDNTTTEETYTRDDLPAIWGDFVPRVVKLENAYRTDKWEKRPSGLCKKYCGNLDCSFNGRRTSNVRDEESDPRVEGVPKSTEG